jgi:uncharacterized membrane protein YccF (DUF307 family)
MRTLGNILWHFPFLGFVSGAANYLLGLLLVATVVCAPIGLGLMELGKFLFWPFGNAMISKNEMKVEEHPLWKTYSGIVMILYLPFGIFLTLVSVVQVAGLFISIIGIPVALVVAKSLGTILNPVNKICVPNAVVAEIDKRKAQKIMDNLK